MNAKKVLALVLALTLLVTSIGVLTVAKKPPEKGAAIDEGVVHHPDKAKSDPFDKEETPSNPIHVF